MNFCYCDESGTGNEPIATMVGIIVDCGRMHLTKADWVGLLVVLSDMTKRRISEIHTADFYSGNGVWRGLDGPVRASVTTAIIDWLNVRKHHIVYSSVNKAAYLTARDAGAIPPEVDSVWKFLGFHVILSLQKYSQPEANNKGHTAIFFDNEERERLPFTDLILSPPSWSDAYYGRGKKPRPKDHPALDQIVDIPWFGDSKAVPLIQLADFVAFFLRRYAEIQEELVPAAYPGEEAKIAGWITALMSRAIPTANVYPKRQRTPVHDLFYQYASHSIRDLTLAVTSA